MIALSYLELGGALLGAACVGYFVGLAVGTAWRQRELRKRRAF